MEYKGVDQAIVHLEMNKGRGIDAEIIRVKLGKNNPKKMQWATSV